MKRIAEKALSCLLVLTMTVSMIPSQVFAADTDADEGDESAVLAGNFDVEFQAEDESRATGAVGSGILDGIIEDDTEPNTVSPQASNFEFSSLSGKVVDSDSQGVSGVSVQIYNIDENTLLPYCTTDSSGLWKTDDYEVIVGYTYGWHFLLPCLRMQTGLRMPA